MKKFMITFICGFLIMVIAVIGIRRYNYDIGKTVGYDTGYEYGYTDGLVEERQDSQILAGNTVPYRFGGSRWKGYIMYFAQGYDDGFEAAEQNLANG